jgi:hypothetical protein
MDQKSRLAHPVGFFLAGFGFVLLPMLMIGLVIGWADYSVADHPQATLLGLAIPVVAVLWLLALAYMWRVLFARKPRS